MACCSRLHINYYNKLRFKNWYWCVCREVVVSRAPMTHESICLVCARTSNPSWVYVNCTRFLFTRPNRIEQLKSAWRKNNASPFDIRIEANNRKLEWKSNIRAIKWLRKYNCTHVRQLNENINYVIQQWQHNKYWSWVNERMNRAHDRQHGPWPLIFDWATIERKRERKSTIIVSIS